MSAAMTEQEYFQIASACDRLLNNADATLEWVAVPWLHVINEHPLNLRKYQGLRENSVEPKDFRDSGTYKVASLTRNFLRAIPYTLGRRDQLGVRDDTKNRSKSEFDIVIVSWLVNVDHLDRDEDFYFGNIQEILADQGFSSLLLLRNQTGVAARKLFERARRGGSQARLLLPDVMDLAREAKFLKRSFQARRQLQLAKERADSRLDRMVAQKASQMVVSHPALAGIRLETQIKEIVGRIRPSVVMSLYEGFAWERCLWHAVRSVDRSILCVGYQHTIIQKHAHAIKRPIGADKQYQPDAILTVGEITRDILEASDVGKDARVLAFGTHRHATVAANPSERRDVLVLPEGIESECLYLFDFALDCARALPDTRFIFRTHPVLPFETIKAKLKKYNEPPENVEISDKASIEDDFARAGYVFYRGSSTVIYGVLAGLKPYYIGRPGEMPIDPLYQLSDWVTRINSAEELVADIRAGGLDKGEWQRARDFCQHYVKPVDPDILSNLVLGEDIKEKKTC